MENDTTDVAVEEEENKFDLPEEQKQYFGSWMGRMVKKQFEESINPQIDELKQMLSQRSEPDGDELTEKILNGGAKEVFEQLLNERDQKQRTLKETRMRDLQKEMTKFSEDPLYKEVYADAENLAKEAMEKGYPVGPAVETAMAKASREYLMQRDPDLSLKMSGSGKPKPRQKKTELPPELKAAAQRDVADGIFESEAEYIKNLTPDVRARYGL